MRCAVVLAALVLAGPASAQGTRPNPSFNLLNRGNQAINELYATPAGVDRWGRDRLGSNSLSPNTSFPVRLPADGNCMYDIRVVYADGKPEEKRRLNTCTIEAVIFPGAQTSGTAPANNTAPGDRGSARTDDPSFRLVNRSRSEVNEVYASLTGEEGWGRDRLGDDTVAAGATRVIRLPAGECRYDVRVVFANGEATEKRKLNLCAITDLRVP